MRATSEANESYLRFQSLFPALKPDIETLKAMVSELVISEEDKEEGPTAV